jgi:monoamine oxidase
MFTTPIRNYITPMTYPDVIILGAGAAGLGAARRLAAAGVAAGIVEARDRVGGRAFTARETSGLPVELGCAWLHSADENELAGLAREHGLTVDKTTPPWRTQLDGIGFPAAGQAAFSAALERLFDRIHEAGDAVAGGAAADQPASRLLDSSGRWNPLLDAVSTYMNGVEWDQVSVHDFRNYHDSGVNWRIAEGYGSLMAALCGGLDITLECPASLIDHSGPVVRIATPRGDLSARAVIVTLPTGVLAAGGLRFHPALPDKIDAAAVLPLGLADKVFLRLDGAEEFPKDSHLYGSTDRAATGTYHLRPFGRPLIECFFGGRCARDLEAAGEAAFADFAISELAALLGEGIRSRLHPVATTAWERDPYARGSYSHALPGHAGARLTLAAPVDGRIFFAGEACMANDFSTAHGAWRSGVAAADAVIAALATR